MPWLRLAGDYGFTLHIGSIDSGITKQGKEFLNKTLMGSNIYFEATGYPWRRGGLGGFFSRYTSDDAASNIRFRPDEKVYASYRSATTFLAFGPLFTSRLNLDWSMLYGGVGAGYLRWRETITVENAEYLLAADTYTVLFTAGLDFPVLPVLALGVHARLFLGSVRKYTVNGETIRNSEGGGWVYYTSLNRLEASVGIRFAL